MYSAGLDPTSPSRYISLVWVLLAVLVRVMHGWFPVVVG